MRDSDIIIFSLSRWDAPYSSPSFSLAKEFAKTNRVFYIDHPVSLKVLAKKFRSPMIQKRLGTLIGVKSRYTRDEKLPEKLTVVTPGITLPINFLPHGPLYDLLSRVNDQIIFGAIREIIRDFNVDKFIFLNCFDPFFCRDFPSDIHALAKVYQSMDDLSQVNYTAKHGKRLEAEIIRKYDATLTTSRELQRLKSAHSEHVYYHPNAADFSNFKRALNEELPRPPELMRAEGKKIIGYTGNIESRIDYQLLRAIIEYHTDKFIVMVGPLTEDEHQSIGLSDYDNVILTGSKKIEELPSYLRYFDCAIIPFKKNTLTRSIYPLKINEYLAAGRPVVATDFSEDILSFGDVIHVTGDTREFVSLIDRAIDENSDDLIRARLKMANRNTWTHRVEEFWEIVEKVSTRLRKKVSAW